jgi:hypothetical protein
MVKIYNESFFDEVFSDTTKTDYKNLKGKFGKRDFKITNCSKIMGFQIRNVLILDLVQRNDFVISKYKCFRYFRCIN